MANSKAVEAATVLTTTFITAYGPKPRVHGTHISPDSRTKQSFKDDCDINNIMARYIKTGVIDFTARNQPRYGDVTGASFESAMATVAAANTMFHELPARVRDRFRNDPAKFLDFVNNPDNKDEARALGLLKPVPEAPAPIAPAGAEAGGQGGSAPTQGAQAQPAGEVKK